VPSRSYEQSLLGQILTIPSVVEARSTFVIRTIRSRGPMPWTTGARLAGRTSPAPGMTAPWSGLHGLPAAVQHGSQARARQPGAAA
jgi:hypothetical protein